MNPSRDHHSPGEIERQLYEAEQFLEGLFPKTADEVRETLAMFGTTPVDLPEQLREPDAVFNRMSEKQQAQQEPTAFGKLLTMLRTQKKLSIEQLAAKTNLDAGDLRTIETVPDSVASPLTVSTIAEYFKLEARNVMRLAGLTRDTNTPVLQKALSVAAYAQPNFDSLTSNEQAYFRALVETLREKGE
jgi:transcriptional regulator with XRE-family HTH domain